MLKSIYYFSAPSKIHISYIYLFYSDGIIEDGTITSDNYNIEEDIISRISPQTTVATFKGIFKLSTNTY